MERKSRWFREGEISWIIKHDICISENGNMKFYCDIKKGVSTTIKPQSALIFFHLSLAFRFIAFILIVTNYQHPKTLCSTYVSITTANITFHLRVYGWIFLQNAYKRNVRNRFQSSDSWQNSIASRRDCLIAYAIKWFRHLCWTLRPDEVKMLSTLQSTLDQNPTKKS